MTRLKFAALYAVAIGPWPATPTRKDTTTTTLLALLIHTLIHRLSTPVERVNRVRPPLRPALRPQCGPYTPNNTRKTSAAHGPPPFGGPHSFAVTRAALTHCGPHCGPAPKSGTPRHPPNGATS